MRSVNALVSVFAAFALAVAAWAGDTALDLATATGTVEAVGKGTVTIQPRGAGGKFAKKLVLKVTGTSKLSLVSKEKRAGKLVPIQRDVNAKDLEVNQHIVVIYVAGAEPVLLSAVLQRSK